MAKGYTTVPREFQEGLTYHSAKLPGNTDAVMAKYGSLINRYCGSLPSRLVAARIDLETGGNPRVAARAQNWYCGIYGSEIGLLQINPCNRQVYGITDAQARDPETNIRIGCEIWNSWIDNFLSGDSVDARTRAVWAWLVTAVGPGAAKRLRELAGGYSISALSQVASNSSLLTQNKSYWGTQGPSLIAWRVGVSISAVNAVVGGMGLFGIALWGAAGYFLFKYGISAFRS